MQRAWAGLYDRPARRSWSPPPKNQARHPAHNANDRSPAPRHAASTLPPGTTSGEARRGSRMDLLITNARVWDDRPPVDIAIEGDRIPPIEQRHEGGGARANRAGGRAVLPGFVEPHLHLDKALIYRRQPA